MALLNARYRHGSGRVLMVGSTERPGRRLPIVAGVRLRMILTGMRWTILVKLPVALSGGRRANCWPEAGAMESTVPVTLRLGKASTVRVTGRCV